MTKALRVLILGLNYAPEPTGIAPYTTGMAHFLAEAGHDVHVITGLPHYPHWEVAPGYRGRRIHEEDGKVRITRVSHPVPAKPTGKSRIAMEAAFALQAAAVAGPRPDVVLAVSPALLTVATALRWRSPGRTAVGVITQDLYSRAIAETGALGGKGTKAAERLERALLRRADGVIAIHESFRRSLVNLGVDDDRITTIRNWTHIKGVVGDTTKLRRRLGWRDDEIVALHAGNMGAKQGLENVVEAARAADRDGLPVRFVLLGAGNQRAYLEGLGAGIERLQFIDPLPGDEFQTAMAAADVLLLNERPEVAEMCVPSKLTSYFASGRPVIAATSTRSAATSEVLHSGGGRLVAPGQPEALLRVVLEVGADKEEALAMGFRGQLFARDALDEGAARTAYVSWVEQLAGRGSVVLATDADVSAIPAPRSGRLRRLGRVTTGRKHDEAGAEVTP
ncbi:glycosyltransferase [Actinomycetospora cinnamomea]|uniref:Glycosyltransferase involved in cell wall biosynthesis n=1 Tax=Actinomycetospora cinnamomea TaxID=663609 RepID=A0A2U1EVI2_9PSEU|nr:glycosyltransferase [Actinomycetospora cinnamomea]PVZ03954.1 glycosyltransferase involved in cell wall biosynthesis [Actinomycetospora cinnamomea]